MVQYRYNIPVVFDARYSQLLSLQTLDATCLSVLYVLSRPTEDI